MYRGKSIVGLREELDSSKTTPEELFEKANKLAHEFQDEYNSFVTIIDKCKYKDRDSKIKGIPYALKDNFSTTGILTTASSNILKDYANKLMFDMNDEEYKTLQDEFEIILKQMDLIGQIPDIDKVSPMTFPFPNTDVSLREDEVGDYLTVSEVLENAKHQVNDQVKVPKVVNEDV